MLELDRASAADFSALLHDSFRLVIPGAAPFDLELVEVYESTRRSPARQHNSFTLLFKGTRDRLLPQQTYRMEHATLAPMELLIVPVREDRDGYCYEAVFN